MATEHSQRQTLWDPQWVKTPPYLDLEHAQRDLEEDQGALVEEQVPYPQQQPDIHHAGERRQEPVQRDQGQL